MKLFFEDNQKIFNHITLYQCYKYRRMAQYCFASIIRKLYAYLVSYVAFYNLKKGKIINIL